MKWIGHIEAVRTIKIKATLETKEPLRIGLGRETKLTSPIDLPIQKIHLPGMGKEVPYIPGSSIKGVFRNHLDTVLRSINGYTCQGTGKYTCMLVELPEYGLKRLESVVKENTSRGDYGKAREILEQNLCLSCKVFGSPGYQSKAVFYDSYPKKEVKIGIKKGIAIDRRTGAVARGALYQIEYIEPGSEFSFTLELKNLPNYILGFIADCIYEMNSGRLKIGGFKSRGFGWAVVKDPELEIHILGRQTQQGKLELEALDDLDEKITIENIEEITRMGYIAEATLRGEKAWEALDKAHGIWVDKIEEIAERNKPRWLKQNV